MNNPKTFVAYYRVSTERQGLSGLGLEAQRKAVVDHINGGSGKVLAEYVEHESGSRDDRPELARAIEHARLSGAVLVIARLDRLSRDAHFLLGLEKAGVEFIACDLPEANRLTLTIMAAVAEHERKLIGERTRQALQAAKARGQRLGNPNGAAALRRAGKGNAAAVASVQAGARSRAEGLRSVLDAIKAEGVTTAAGMARALNARGIVSPRGSIWTATAVRRVQARLT